MVKFQIVKLSEMPQCEFEMWQSICDQNPNFRSPYFQPAFTKCVARVRDDAFVILATQDGHRRGYLPVQVNLSKHAMPIGGKLNDLHGMICDQDFNFDIDSMLAATGLKSYSFHSACVGIQGFETNQFETLQSPTIDLASGVDKYLDWVKRQSVTVRRQGQKTRKMISEVGPLRFDFHTEDESTFERVIELKREQYLRTKTFDLFSLDWALDLVGQIYRTNKEEFSGVLSVLWAGDELIAGHMGLRSKSVLHYWFPVYNNRFAKYSPGIQLLLEMCKGAAHSGLESIDLGYGNQEFKQKLSNTHYDSVCGKLATSRISFSASRQWHFAKKWMMSTAVRPHVKNVVRTINPSFGHWVFR